jgi:hypothetical protein
MNSGLPRRITPNLHQLQSTRSSIRNSQQNPIP